MDTCKFVPDEYFRNIELKIINFIKNQTDMKKRGKLIYPLMILGCVMILCYSCKKSSSTSSSNPTSGPTVTDADGNVYPTVVIGTQTWMAANLKTTKYNDGTSIPLVTDGTAWSTDSTAAYCWYNNDESTYKNPYGALYNWYAVNTGKLAPTGWHVPTYAEWLTLITYLADSTTAGGKLKEAGTTHWWSPNTGATNSTGFTGVPSGSRYSNGFFYLNGEYVWIWSSTAASSTDGYHVYLVYNSNAIFRKGGAKNIGFSVRCVKN
jgi:uncharacterized protein (TIGR02145 family)